MILMARAKLTHRTKQLQTLLMTGNDVQVIAARELLRLSLVELHELGYWQEHPEQFKTHMLLYREAARINVSPPASRFAPDKMDRCIP